MIEESRSIVLSDSELLTALSPLLEEVGINKDHELEGIEFDHDETGEILVKLQYEGADEPIIFDHMEAGRAVLHHCIAQRIPLPRGSHKELALRGDHLALIVRIVTGDD